MTTQMGDMAGHDMHSGHDMMTTHDMGGHDPADPGHDMGMAVSAIDYQSFLTNHKSTGCHAKAEYGWMEE